MKLSHFTSLVFVSLFGRLVHAQIASPSIVTLDGSFTQATTSFGARTAIDGERAIIGCRPSAFGSGSNRAYIYERTASGWTLVASFSGAGRYSTGVDISGDRAVVGAPYISGEKMYVYERSGGVWSQFQIIDGYIDGHDWFGECVAVDGDWAACTSPESLSYNGPVYLYQRGATTWNAAGVLEDPSGYWSGEALDMSLPRVVTGDPDADNDRGRAVVFRLAGVGGNGVAEAILQPNDLAQGDQFATALVIQGDRIVVGAPYHDLPGVANAGAAYVFERIGGTWTQTAKLVATAPSASEWLGIAVTLDGDRIVLGAHGEAYVFECIGGAWSQTAVVTPPIASTFFGSAVALDGSHLLIGARDIQTVFSYELTLAPSIYCTAKVNSQGCTPAIAFSGIPSATLAQPFVIGATSVINQKGGTLFYGTTGRLAQPFQGGTICVASPRRRTGVQSSGGNVGPDDCSGAYTYEFNARIQGGLDPALIAGVAVDAQYWMRDGQSSFQTGFSDALELVIAP